MILRNYNKEKGVIMEKRRNENIKMLLGGAVIGLLAVILTKLGNPGNMGLCLACFWRDIAGALGLHKAPVVQYIRPEIIGFVIGAFITSIISGDFKSRGGSSPLIRFFLGAFMAIGSLVFLGCPFRLILRLANGDLNALVALAGFLVGIFVGIQFLKKGYTLDRNHGQNKVSGLIMPAFAVFLLLMLLVAPAFIAFSTEGPGSMHAPVFISLGAGLVVGFILQRTRLCSAAAFRDLMLIKNAHFLWGIVGMFGAALIANLAIGGSFNLGFTEQPVAHNMHLWNFLGMFLVGLTAILVGGCPIRQTILSGEGDADAALMIFGLMIGAAFAHNFGLAASGEGVPVNGQIALIICIILTLVIGIGSIKGAER